MYQIELQRLVEAVLHRKKGNMQKTRNISKVDPHMVALHGNYDYIKVVVQDLLAIIKEQDRLAQEVLTLNPECLEIGAGKLSNLIELSKEIVWR